MSQEFPSPSQYNIPQKTFEGPKYQFGLKTIDLSRKRESLPGPGNYDTVHGLEKIVVKDPSFSIGRSKRLD